MSSRNKSIFLSGQKLQEILPKSIFPLLYQSNKKPTKNWHQIIDGNMLRFDIEAMLSLFFPNGIDCRTIWNRAIITYDSNSSIISSNISKYVKSPNIILKSLNSSDGDEPILVMGWMYKQDTRLIIDNI